MAKVDAIEHALELGERRARIASALEEARVVLADAQQQVRERERELAALEAEVEMLRDGRATRRRKRTSDGDDARSNVGADADSHSSAPLTDRIVDLLRATPTESWRASEVAEELEDASVEAVRTALHRLRKAGRIRRIRQGLYRGPLEG